VDGDMLLYLADPLMHLVTRDEKLRIRVGGSGQEDRVVLLRELT
jgi:hypothetical protein